MKIVVTVLAIAIIAGMVATMTMHQLPTEPIINLHDNINNGY